MKSNLIKFHRDLNSTLLNYMYIHHNNYNNLSSGMGIISNNCAIIVNCVRVILFVKH